MGGTSITLSTDTKNRLATDHRADAHDSWDDTLTGMMEMLPTVDDLQGGCDWKDCDKNLHTPPRPEHQGGVIQWFHTIVPPNDNEVYGVSYYCSAEHARLAAEETQKHVPQEPDVVIVGGCEMQRAEVKGARFYLDYDTMEVGIDVPGAFGGKDSHGNTYEYVGEPVYIKEDGKVRMTGIIDDIIHEESHTALISISTRIMHA